jgi:adenosine deaminase
MTDAMLLRSLLSKPKVDLHRHLTGSIDAKAAVRIAAKYDVQLPTYVASELEDRLYHQRGVTNHEEYFIPWETLNSLFVSEDAAYEIILEVLGEAAKDNVVYAEFRTGPRGFLGSEYPKFDQYLDVIARSTAEAEERFGIVARWILGIPRHVFGPISEDTRNSMCARIINMVYSFYPRYFVGIDLNGNEDAASAELFDVCFKMARNKGLPITVHAGETGPASSVEYAVEKLHASRIGHGVSAWSDLHLLALMAERDCALEICPTSNKLLRVLTSIEDLPLRTLRESGVPFSICSDNPARCRISLTEELYKVATAFSLPLSEIREITYCALDHSFADQEIRHSIRARLDNGWNA